MEKYKLFRFWLDLNSNIGLLVRLFRSKTRLTRHASVLIVEISVRLFWLKSCSKTFLFYLFSVDCRRRIVFPETSWALCTILSFRTITIIALTCRLCITDSHYVLYFFKHRICFLWLHDIKKAIFATSWLCTSCSTRWQ